MSFDIDQEYSQRDSNVNAKIDGVDQICANRLSHLGQCYQDHLALGLAYFFIGVTRAGMLLYIIALSVA